MTTDNTVASTILQQLGGNRFIAMTGARDFVRGENYLQFKLNGRMTDDGINLVVIRLEANDYYMIQFYRQRGINLTEIARKDFLSPQMLRDQFVSYTGLDIHL